MARYGAAPAAQTQEVTLAIMAGLRHTLPSLLKAQQAYAVRYVICIRNGVIDHMDQWTWDEQSEEIRHVNPGDFETQARKIESVLLRDMPSKLGDASMHGEIHLTVTVRDKTVAFALKQKRQRRFTWKHDGTSAT